jgi:hypothetical protein
MQKLAAAELEADALRPDMERLDLSEHTFPHPFFGDLTAAEWLVVAGGHEMRHTLQIQRVLEQIRHYTQKSPGRKEGDPTGETTSNSSS